MDKTKINVNTNVAPRITVPGIPAREAIDRAAFPQEEFMSRVRAMSRDELEMIVDYVPIELCMNRISKEIEEANHIKETIKATAAAFEK